MAISPFIAAINQIADEKGLARETVMETVEAAIAAAYRKDYGHPDDIVRATIGEDLDDITITRVRMVVPDEEFENEQNQISLTEAQKLDASLEVGGEVTETLEPHHDFGRIAAQTAKQVIIQRLREAERDILFNEFKDKEHKVVTGSVQQIEGDSVLVNLGKMTALMMPSDQIPNEQYYVGQRLKVFVAGVEETPRGPRVIVSRTHPELIAQLFFQEVPELQSGAVEIRAISREAGSRTKLAVAATQEGIDPVGSCVGGRGARVQAVLAELPDEKIDIALWDEDSVNFITNALSPANVENVQLFPDLKKALVSVPEDQLSLAIGRAGQNVRLASRLTGWSIDIAQTGMEEEKIKEITDKAEEAAAANSSQTEPAEEAPKKRTKKAKTEEAPVVMDEAPTETAEPTVEEATEEVVTETTGDETETN